MTIDKKTEEALSVEDTLKLVLEALNILLTEPIAHKAADKAEYLLLQAAPAIREALAAVAKPHKQQEPVAICEYCEKERPVIQAKGKPWVGLTRPEIAKASADAQADFCLDKQPTYEVALARAIETKLREKNA